MNKSNKNVEKAITMFLEGFEGSEEQIIGQRDAWERFLHRFDKDNIRLKKNRIVPIEFVKDLKSSLSNLLNTKAKESEDLVNKIMIIWRNVYLIQTETQDGKFMTVGDRIDAYNRKVKELEKWKNSTPLWFDDNSRSLVLNVIQTELSSVWQKYKLEWFLADRINQSSLGFKLIGIHEKVDTAINEGVRETDLLLEKVYKRPLIIEIVEVCLTEYNLSEFSKVKEVSATSRIDEERDKRKIKKTK